MSHHMDDDSMDMRMYMIINWENQVAFVFKEWKSTNNSEFIFGLLLTFIFVLFLTTIPILKQFAEDKKSLFLKVIWQLLTATQASIAMIIMMTVNGWVLLVMALGVGVGSFIFYENLPVYRKFQKEKENGLMNSI